MTTELPNLPTLAHSAKSCLCGFLELRLRRTVSTLQDPVSDKVSELLGRRLNLVLGLVVETRKKLVRFVVSGARLNELGRRLGAADLVLLAVVEEQRKVLRPRVPGLLRVERRTVAQHVGQGAERAGRLTPRVVLSLLLNLLVVRELLRGSASDPPHKTAYLDVERSRDAEVAETEVGGESSSLDLNNALGCGGADERSADNDTREKFQRALSRHAGDARREAKAQSAALFVSFPCGRRQPLTML